MTLLIKSADLTVTERSHFWHCLFFHVVSPEWICDKFESWLVPVVPLSWSPKLNSLGIRSDSVSQNNTVAAAALNIESWQEQDANHVTLSPASLHLTSMLYLFVKKKNLKKA